MITFNEKFYHGFLHPFVLRQSEGFWIALCLENAVVGQGLTKDEAIWKLKDAISSIEMAIQDEPDIYSAPISIQELHEFLTYEDSIADDLAI